MGRKTGRDRGVRPMGEAKIRKILERTDHERDIFAIVGVSTSTVAPVRMPREIRPIDEWPISRDVFAGLAREKVANIQDLTRPTMKAVARIASSWTSPSAAQHAAELARHWGEYDYRGGDRVSDSISWQLYYELQDQRDTPLPGDTMLAAGKGIRGACETLGLDYETLNSVVGRTALHHTQDPFYVAPPVSDRWSW